MNKNYTIIIILATLLIVLAWSPWITKNYAETKTENTFVSNWEGVIDGCGFNCNDCGVIGSSRIIFGYSVDIEYACGLLPADEQQYHKKDTAFVSCFGTVHGLTRA